MKLKDRLRNYIRRKHPAWHVVLPIGQCLQCGADLAGTERVYLCEQCAPETECILREIYLDRPDCDDCVIKESEVNHQ